LTACSALPIFTAEHGDASQNFQRESGSEVCELATPLLRSVHILHFKGVTNLELKGCGPINALFGKNNSGKSSVLHAIDMAGLALSQRNWDLFPLKRSLADLFSDAGPFTITLEYGDGSMLTVQQQAGALRPTFDPEPTDSQRFGSLLLVPDIGTSLLQSQIRPPADTMSYVEQRNFSVVSGADILYALKHYGQRNQRGLKPGDYEELIQEVRQFFPELDGLEADLTDRHISTVTYEEYGKHLDLLYAGAGLKHLLDILVKARLAGARVVLIDEPENGLHPELQRRFLAHLERLAETRGFQFFLATHTPVLLSEGQCAALFGIRNRRGARQAEQVPSDAIHTLWGDLGVRPSDFLQADMVLMVEGQDDVLFWEHVIRNVYGGDFGDISVSVVQYGGSAASAIISGVLDFTNITAARGYVLWLHDRDAPPGDKPSPDTRKLVGALEKAGQECWVGSKRELEYYLPESLHVEAQQGDEGREAAVRAALAGDQRAKFDELAKKRGFVHVKGKKLRELLPNHVTRDTLDAELSELVERTLLRWRRELLGESG